MNEILIMLSTLMCYHFLLDFAIQGDFVAKFKARLIDGENNIMWKWVLTAHAASHTLPVIILTESLALSGIMFLSHFIIDFLKCEQRINFNQDQTLHIFVILLITWLSFV